ncbi:MAG TPA: response regulator [Thermoflexia bacterium]|nr:response regulator [Thermoflexia bacterium]
MDGTILIVEDDLLAARLLERQLSSEGYRILIASNGLQGLRMCQTEQPDLVLLDLMLPGMDGFEVLSRLRSDPRTAEVPVVIVSAKTDPADQEMATRMGANAYLTKPFQRAELLETVRSLMRKGPDRGRRSTGVLLVGAYGEEATQVGTRLGATLASEGMSVTLADLRPFSVEPFLVLGIPAPSEPLPLSDVGAGTALLAATVRHPSGLRVLGNLKGRGTAGQMEPEDVTFVLDLLLNEPGCVLSILPLYPLELLLTAMELLGAVLLVARNDMTSAAAARTALTLMEQGGVDKDRIHLVLLGSPSSELPEGLDRPVLGVVSERGTEDERSYRALAERLKSLLCSVEEGGNDAG